MGAAAVRVAPSNRGKKRPVAGAVKSRSLDAEGFEEKLFGFFGIGLCKNVGGLIR